MLLWNSKLAKVSDSFGGSACKSLGKLSIVSQKFAEMLAKLAEVSGLAISGLEKEIKKQRTSG
jgi:hypothetical protein